MAPPASLRSHDTQGCTLRTPPGAAPTLAFSLLGQLTAHGSERNHLGRDPQWTVSRGRVSYLILQRQHILYHITYTLIQLCKCEGIVSHGIGVVCCVVSRCVGMLYSAILSPEAILGRGRYPLVVFSTGPRSSRGLLALGVTGVRSCGLWRLGTSLRIESASIAGCSCCTASAEACVGEEPGERLGTLPGSECVFRLPRLVVLSELTVAVNREAALVTVVLAA